MIIKISLFILCLTCIAHADGLTIVDHPDALPAASALRHLLPQTSRGTRGLRSAQVHCAPLLLPYATEQLVLFSLFNQQAAMNLALQRATHFIERSPGQVLTDLEHLNSEFHTTMVGLDLRGEDLARFWQKFQSEPSSTQPSQEIDKLKLALEFEYWTKFLVPKLTQDPNFILITLNTNMRPRHVRAFFRHELLHVRYFTDVRYRALVQEFWRTHVIPGHQSLIKHSLSQAYFVEDEFILCNEFQAYLFQDRNNIRPESRYRNQLLKFLADNGVSLTFELGAF